MAQSPGAHVEVRGVCRIHEDVIHNQVVGSVEFREAAPGDSAVERLIEPTVGRTHVDVIGVTGDSSKRAGIAAGGANRAPGGLRRKPLGAEHEQNREEDGRQPFVPAQAGWRDRRTVDQER